MQFPNFLWIVDLFEISRCVSIEGRLLLSDFQLFFCFEEKFFFFPV